MVYITGDMHRKLSHIEDFCREYHTSTDDVLIVLGDAGFNFYGDFRDDCFKDVASDLPITFLCIRGNHENRPENVESDNPDMSYTVSDFYDGRVYVQSRYPNIKFAIDGEIYNINGNKCICIGGAYSVDKYVRLDYGFKWFKDEQLSDKEKLNIFNNISKTDKKFDFVFTHTCPYDVRPTHLFLDNIDQSEVDSSMEEWLQSIADIITFKRWYFGHFHDDGNYDKYTMLFDSIIPLGEKAKSC